MKSGIKLDCKHTSKFVSSSSSVPYFFLTGSALSSSKIISFPLRSDKLYPTLLINAISSVFSLMSLGTDV
jgi:hypothetical protein